MSRGIGGVGLAMAALLLWGCSSGSSGSSRGTVAGTVTNSLTGDPIAGAMVTVDPDVLDAPVMTDAGGNYSTPLPIGNYSVTIEATYYDSQSSDVSVVANRTTDIDAALVPPDPVVILMTSDGTGEPGTDMEMSMEVIPLDGSTLQSVEWTQSNSVDVEISDPLAPQTTITLPPLEAYREELVTVLREPPISEDQLPPNIELPPGGFVGGLPNRFQVIGINPFALEEAGIVTMTANVTTTSGVHTEELDVHAALPWQPTTGLRNVPLGAPVLLNARSHVDEDSNGLDDTTGATVGVYDWAMTPPAGSAATLADATTQNPSFTPDVEGEYLITVTDTTRLPGTDVVSLDVVAGQWEGAITGQDANGNPTAEVCTLCHDGGIAPDNFTQWVESGHARAFANNLDTNTHFGENCFGCHSVGYDTGNVNNGFDDAPDYVGFLDSGLINNPGDNFTTALEDYPDAMQLSNVQCENCHGPHNLASHPTLTDDARRVSLSADVCATCHGEPLRHARYQQWQLSAHSNYELATEEGESGSCARCHTANGFLAWLPILLDDDPLTDPLDDIEVTWTADEVHPQTCATCHDPHNAGTTSGIETDATVRISGSTPPLIAGFTAEFVGRGAICMTCHNSRRGLHNDETWPDLVAAGEMTRAPHGSAQADVLMGENAFLVTTGVRGNHSRIEDTCVKCHMVATPPPAILSYNQGGTNHTFFASPDVCGSCHGDALTAPGVQAPIEAKLVELKGLMEAAILDLIAAAIDDGNTVSIGGTVVDDASTIASIEFTEARGRQAITVTFTDETATSAVALNSVQVLDPSDAPIGELYEFADDYGRPDLPQAGWNYNLINNDGSKGVHNPTFATAALNAAINAAD